MSSASKISLARVFDVFDRSILAQTFWIIVFAAATALGAQVQIPTSPVPFTLQTIFVLLGGALLGARNGAASQILYLIVGVLGAPVFAGGGFGLARLVGPTGGYLAGFPIAAAAVGFMIQYRKGLPWIVLSMATGLFIVFTCGTLHLWAYYIRDFSAAFMSGFLLFSWWDLLKLAAASMLYREVARRWPRIGS